MRRQKFSKVSGRDKPIGLRGREREREREREGFNEILEGEGLRIMENGQIASIMKAEPERDYKRRVWGDN